MGDRAGCETSALNRPRAIPLPDTFTPAMQRGGDELEWRTDLLIEDLLARPTERTTHAR
jgi:hypothetical protein